MVYKFIDVCILNRDYEIYIQLILLYLGSFYQRNLEQRPLYRLITRRHHRNYQLYPRASYLTARCNLMEMKK